METIAMSETVQQLSKLISQGETLTVEFKSDLKSLPDRDLLAAVVKFHKHGDRRGTYYYFNQ